MLEYIFFWRDCQKYNVSLWKCPIFLFIIMGLITIFVMVGVYLLGSYYGSQELVIITVFISMLIIFVPGTVIVKSFEQMALTDRMKSEFVSIASHQLRTPLTAVKWSLGFLLDNRAGEIKGEQRRYLDLVHKNNEQMIVLVKDLLNVSRIDRKELNLNREKIKIADILEPKIPSFEQMAEIKNITLEFEKESPDFVWGDEVFLGMVVANFISNAIKYSKSKDGKITVRLFTKNRSVRYEVIDNGIGIPKNEQDMIFSKFFRSNNVKKLKVEGTGLGLYIAKAVIEKLGGKIGFKSTEGAGSTFWFELPIIK